MFVDITPTNKLVFLFVIVIMCLFMACESEDEKNSSLLVDGYEWVGTNPSRNGNNGYEYSAFTFEGSGYSGRGSETVYSAGHSYDYRYTYEEQCITLDYDGAFTAYIDNVSISGGRLKGTYYSSTDDFQGEENGRIIILDCKNLKIKPRQ